MAVRDVVTSVVVARRERRSLEDGTTVSTVSTVATVSTVSTSSHGEGKAVLWKSRRTTPEAEEQELAEDASPEQQHLKTQ